MSNNLEIKKNALPLTTSIEACMQQFFKSIDSSIEERSAFDEGNGTLDFMLMRRFLVTMFNNMREMDPNFVTPKMYKIYKDLKDMSTVFDDYQSKVAFPEIAFEKVFLSKQKAYMQLKNENDKLTSEIGIMEVEERSLRAQIEHKRSVLDQLQRGSYQYSQNASDVRQIKGKYADIVHKIASKKEEQQKNFEKMHEFEALYKGHFQTLFNSQSKKYRAAIVSVLNAQAYVFDFTLWEQAKASKVIQKYFKEAQIKGEFCSSTYLHYYLNSLNVDMLSEEQAEMQKLYEYLRNKECIYIIVVMYDLEDAIDMKATLSTSKLDYEVVVFIDEVKSLKWAKKYRVGLMILEEQLDQFSAKQYIQAYKSRVSESTRSIVISNASKEKIGADTVLETRHTKAELVNAVKELLE